MPEGAVSGTLLATPADARYQPVADERYEQPEPDATNPAPVYPPELLSESLPPAVVRVRLIVSAGGSVQRVEPLNPDPTQPPAFFAATEAAVMQWFYQPLVRIRPGPELGTVVDDRGDSAMFQGTASSLPFHLDYEFVFRQQQGRGWVDAQSTATSASELR